MVRLSGATAVDIAAKHFAHLGVIAHADEAWTETVLRAGPARGLRLLGDAHDGDSILQRRRQRPTDVEALAGLQDGGRLLHVLAAIEAHDHHSIALAQKLIDRPDHLHAGLGDGVLPLREAVDAFGDVLARRAGERGNYLEPCEIAG